MWALSNKTPFPARVSAFRDHTGASFWGLWIKSTFAMRPDRPALFINPQPPLVIDPVYQGEAFIADSDLSQPKPQVDLIMSGTVTPNTDGTKRTMVVQLGSLNVSLDVHPPWRQNWRKAWVHDEDATVRPVPIDARSAYGGPDFDENPVGLGADGDTPAYLGVPEEVPPKTVAHLGSVAPTTTGRAKLAGTYDEAWQSKRAPLLPEDFDLAYWQSAPTSRRISRPLLVDAPLILVGFGAMDGTYPLPHLSLHCATRIAGAWQDAMPALQTIAIDFEHGTISLLYLAVWPIASATADVDISETKVMLDSWDAFRVRPRDVDAFTPSARLQQVSE